MEMEMILKNVWRIALLAILCVALAANAEADSLKTAADTVITLAAVGVVAIVTVVVVVIHNSSKKRTITGCVNSAPVGMTMADEKDKRVYTLSGDTTGVRPGQRMTLQGKKLNANADHTLTWGTKKMIKDLGVCQP
jgi:hypothetical protein